jgi:hypothetical protein
VQKNFKNKFPVLLNINLQLLQGLPFHDFSKNLKVNFIFRGTAKHSKTLNFLATNPYNNERKQRNKTCDYTWFSEKTEFWKKVVGKRLFRLVNLGFLCGSC